MDRKIKSEKLLLEVGREMDTKVYVANHIQNQGAGEDLR